MFHAKDPKHRSTTPLKQTSDTSSRSAITLTHSVAHENIQWDYLGSAVKHFLLLAYDV